MKQGLREQPVETLAAITHELEQMLRLKVFKPIDARTLTAAQHSKVINSSMFLKHKYMPQGKFVKCKARLVAGGNLQDKSLYANTSSPTASPTAILTTAGIAARDMKSAATIDIGGAYLNADMAPTGVDVDMVIDAQLSAVIIALDPRFAGYVKPNGSLVVRLLKALYGTVEAARLWYDLITSILVNAGFVPNPIERCVLNRREHGRTLTVVLYVDDILVLGDIQDILWFKAYLESRFPEVTFHGGKVLDYVGMTLDFAANPGRLAVTIKQSIHDIISTSAVTKVHPTPATESLFDVDPTSIKLSIAEEAYYRTFVAKLLYLAKRVRPEILTAVSFLTTRVQMCTVDDMQKLKRVIGYLAGEPDRGCRNGRKSMTDLSQLARRLGMASAYHNQLGR